MWPSLDKRKSEPVHRLNGSLSWKSKKQKLSDGDQLWEEDSEIVFWIDFWDTEFPKLRSSALTLSKEKKLQDEEKESGSNSKSEDDSDPFRIPSMASKTKCRTISDKFVNHEKLLVDKEPPKLLHTTPTKGTIAPAEDLEVQVCKPLKEETNIGSGKSHEYTNPSQNNDHEHNVCEKDLPIQSKLQSASAGFMKSNFDVELREVDFMKPEIDLHDHEDSFDSHRLHILQPKAIEEMPKVSSKFGFVHSKPIEYEEMEDVHSMGDLDEKHMNIEGLDEHSFNYNEIPIPAADFNDHSGFLHDDLIESHHYYD